MTDVIGAVLLVVGAVVSVLAAWGVVDFPTPLARMHAATKPASLGLAVLTSGAAVAAGSWGLAGIAVLVSGFLFVTTPISGHMLGRAAYGAGQAGSLVHDDLAGVDTEPLRSQPVGRRVAWWRVATLALVWALLWRDPSPGTIVAGAVVGLVVESVVPRSPRAARVSPAGVGRFLLRYLGLVVGSTARVAWEVVTPRNERVREGIVAVPLRTRSTTATLLLANAITYTPGTLTIEVSGDPPTLYVHVLHFESPEQVIADVRRIEDLVLAALPAAADA